MQNFVYQGGAAFMGVIIQMLHQVVHRSNIPSDFIWPFLRPYMGVIPNPKMAFIFPISCILALIFSILIKYFPKCVGKGSFPKSQIKSLESKIERFSSVCSLVQNISPEYTELKAL